MAKLTRRKRAKSGPRYPWLTPEERPVTLDTFKIDGFRYPLEVGRVFRANDYDGRARGYHTVRKIEQWPDGRVEISSWWTSTRLINARTKAQWHTKLPESVVAITREVRI